MARRRCFSYLAEDIIFDILSRLSVKSLLRFKSVCKLWRFIISNNRFIQSHLANSYKKKAVLLNYRSDIADYKYIEVHDHDTHQQPGKLYMPPHDAPIIYINSCHCLVCLSSNDSDVIYIWNPSTKRFKLLPTPNKDFSKGYVDHAGKIISKGFVYLGLGFDAISNDYKLLRIVFRNLPDHPYAPPEAEMYSSNADSWKEISETLVIRRYFPRLSKFVQAKTGVLYLESWKELLAFELHNEVFTLYPFPTFCYARSNVLDYESHVAMIFETSDRPVLGLYMLDDVCATVSWTKMLNLEIGLMIDWVFRYLGDGQFVARNYCGSHNFIYDCRKRETKHILLVLSSDGTKRAVKYTESLVSVNGFEEQELGGK